MPTCPVFAGPVTYLECDIRLFRNSAIPLFRIPRNTGSL